MWGDRRRKRLAQVATLLSGGHLATVAPLRDDEDGNNPREKQRGSQNAIQAQEHCRSPIAVDGLPDQMKVEADRDIGVSAKTVVELRKVAAWPDNLVITTPQERSPESANKGQQGECNNTPRA
jgi:hypothetical protein